MGSPDDKDSSTRFLAIGLWRDLRAIIKPGFVVYLQERR